LKYGRVTPPYFSMSVIDDVIQFSHDYVNHPSSRTAERKAKIRQALLKLTGQKLGDSCGICYLEAIFKIINRTKMSNYELKKGYVAQFPGQGYHGVKSFTNLNLKLNPAKYEPIAEEYLRLHPERAIYFVKIPKIVVAPPKPIVNPVVAPVKRFVETDFNPVGESLKILSDVIEKPKRPPRRKTVKKNN